MSIMIRCSGIPGRVQTYTFLYLCTTVCLRSFSWKYYHGSRLEFPGIEGYLWLLQAQRVKVIFQL